MKYIIITCFPRYPKEDPSKLRKSFQYIRNALSEAQIELKESINDITENVSDQGIGPQLFNHYN